MTLSEKSLEWINFTLDRWLQQKHHEKVSYYPDTLPGFEAGEQGFKYNYTGL